MGGFGDLVGSLAGGGLEKAISKLDEKGLGDKAKSWIGTGANEAISSDQVKDVLENDQIEAVAKKLGVSPDQAADAIAEYLPEDRRPGEPGREAPRRGRPRRRAREARQAVATRPA